MAETPNKRFSRLHASLLVLHALAVLAVHGAIGPLLSDYLAPVLTLGLTAAVTVSMGGLLVGGAVGRRCVQAGSLGVLALVALGIARIAVEPPTRFDTRSIEAAVQLLPGLLSLATLWAVRGQRLIRAKISTRPWTLSLALVLISSAVWWFRQGDPTAHRYWPVRGTAVLADAELIASADSSGCLHLWDAKTARKVASNGQCPGSLKRLIRPPGSRRTFTGNAGLAVSHDESTVAVASRGRVELYRFGEWDRPFRTVNDADGTTPALSADGSTLAVASSGAVRVYDSSGRLVATHPGVVGAFALDPTGTAIVVQEYAKESGYVLIRRDLNDHTERTLADGLKHRFDRVAIDTTGRRVVACGVITLRIGLKDGVSERFAEGFVPPSCAISPSGRFIIGEDEDRLVRYDLDRRHETSWAHGETHNAVGPAGWPIATGAGGGLMLIREGSEPAVLGSRLW